jgi:hypothetical protein
MMPSLNLEFIMTKSTLTITKPSRSGVAPRGGEGFETAAILASTSPLGITAMGAFPLSLIALGQVASAFDDTLTLRPKRTMNAAEELESPQKIEIAALTEQIETTKPGARPYPRCASEHLIRLRFPVRENRTLKPTEKALYI